MAKQSERTLFVPDTDETRHGYRLWFASEFKQMMERAIDEYLWDDEKAMYKAYDAAQAVLRPILSTDPPTVHIKVKNGFVAVSLYWPESKEIN